MKKSEDGCGCEKTRKRWRLIRLALLLAGLSLALYMPWKAATQFESLERIYGPWFLQGAVVAAAGLLFTFRPGFAARTPLVLRIGVAAAAVLWLRTGLACTPHLFELTRATPAQGLFASFHMFVQHVFLALGVVAFAVAPRVLASRIGMWTAGDAVAAESSASEPVVDSALR